MADKDKKEITIKEGDFILLLPDEIHQYKNTSENMPLVFIWEVPKAFE